MRIYYLLIVAVTALGASLLNTKAIGQAAVQVDQALLDLQQTTLTQPQLKRYEEQALFKLQDVLEYAQILTDLRFDIQMRQAARTVILEAFIPYAELPCEWLMGASSQVVSAPCPASDVLNKLIANAGNNDRFQFQGIAVSEAPVLQSDDLYHGVLTYQVNHEVSQQSIVYEVQYQLKRQPKQFGNAETMVWEVRFLSVE